MTTAIRRVALVTLGLALGLGLDSHLDAAAGQEPALRLTSPMGRTGVAGTIRVVASLVSGSAGMPTHVRFQVDGRLLGDDTDGPPYDALWIDDNPFEPRTLSVEAEFASGMVLRDTRVLAPMPVSGSAEVRSIVVDTTVLDAQGRPVTDLLAAEFELREDSRLERLDIAAPQREPALFALLVDSSQSMASQGRNVRRAAGSLLTALAPEDSVVVAPFARGVLSVTGPTTDRRTALDAISAIAPSGGTAILDSLRAMAETLRPAQLRRAIVLMTDGYDEDSEAQGDAVIEALRDGGITLYVIGIGGIAGMSLKGEHLLTRMAAASGGRAWFPRDLRRLGGIYEAIVSDVHHKYLLVYTPSNQARDGTWRAIDIQVRRAGVTVRARPGYAAPSPSPIRASLEFSAVSLDQAAEALTAERLIVREQGVQQQIDVFEEAVLPVTIMLALDSSGSMRRSAAAAQQAAREFILALRPEDELGMLTFADVVSHIHAPTLQRDWSLKAVEGYVTGGGTALNDAVHEALTSVSAVKDGRRAIVLVTDGRDENASSNGPGSLRQWSEVLALLRSSEAVVYAVGVGSRVDRGRLQELADFSGGEAYFAADGTTLAANYGRIVDALRRRYVVGWESTNRTPGGGWRPVEITAGDRMVVRSRAGYFPPPE